MQEQLGLFDDTKPPRHHVEAASFADELAGFVFEGQTTERSETSAELNGRQTRVPTFTNEFWTSRQRAASRLHEISYRACFKPQLPRFFIERLTKVGDRVYDPFMGRGTTVIEAALNGRLTAGCDINPLSQVLVGPRLAPPTAVAVQKRLEQVNLSRCEDRREDLLAFYHPETLTQICALREHLMRGEAAGTLDGVDRWIRMVAVNRLTGHSPGFFSVYSLPPNQAVSVDKQLKFNAERNQVPPLRDVKHIIARKTRSLLRDCDESACKMLARSSPEAILLVGAASHTPQLATGSVDLVVTSPPFLDVVDYAGDNWLRCWFCGIDVEKVEITITKRVDDWRTAMARVFEELARVVRPGGHVAFEVGEVRGGTVKLEEVVIPAAQAGGLSPELVLINSQVFTKTAACWGVTNNKKGTNTNRIVVRRRP